MTNNKGQEDKHTDKNQEKWVTFTHSGKEVEYITMSFRGTNSKRAYKTNNTVEKKKSWQTTTGGRSMNLAEVVFGNSHVQILGRMHRTKWQIIAQVLQ